MNAMQSTVICLACFSLIYCHFNIYIYTTKISDFITKQWIDLSEVLGLFFCFCFSLIFFLSLNYDLFNFLRSDCDDGSPDFVSLCFLQFWSGFFPFSLQHSNKNKIIVNSDSLTNYLSLCVYVCVCVCVCKYVCVCVCVCVCVRIQPYAYDVSHQESVAWTNCHST